LSDQSGGGRQPRERHDHPVKPGLGLASTQAHLREHQKEKVYLIPALLEVPDQAQITPTRKRCLKAESISALGVKLNFCEHQSSSVKRGIRRKKRCHPLRDQVSVDEIMAVSIIRKKFSCERCLTRAVWPGNDIEVWLSIN
jgi:hypothetical protein